MKREFLQLTYNQWENKNSEQPLCNNEVEKQIRSIGERIQALKGVFMSEKAIMSLDDDVNGAQADIHRQGFFDGFETACAILREMVLTE